MAEYYYWNESCLCIPCTVACQVYCPGAIQNNISLINEWLIRNGAWRPLEAIDVTTLFYTLEKLTSESPNGGQLVDYSTHSYLQSKICTPLRNA